MRCLGSLFGIRLSHGGSVHTVLRAAARCELVYASIRQTVGRSEWVVPDETGWRVGGHSALLHTLVGPEANAYIIDPTRSGAVAEATLGLDYDGTIIHDGWSPMAYASEPLIKYRPPSLDFRQDEGDVIEGRGRACELPDRRPQAFGDFFMR
jgi:hypothetical protein